MTKNKLLFYCQHVLGMGHLIRSMEIVRGLSDFEVCFLNGGEIVAGFKVPPGVQIVNLPPIKSDASFSAIQVAQGFESLEAVKVARTSKILSIFDQFKPDVLVIELFPFGRKKFAFELLPLLERIRLRGKQVKVVCSLRDILVAKSDRVRYETRVTDLINRYFDLVLIHADPQFQKLEETFSATSHLEAEIKYTGYVAQPLAQDQVALPFASTDKPLLLASIGGGRVGSELLHCTIEASAVLEKRLPHHLLVFTGPYFPDDQFTSLQKRVKDRPSVSLQRYTTQFLSFMARADLSISMAGYNTCMNLLTTGIRALVLPFTGGENNEQTIRAEKLEALGLVKMIRPDELEADSLAEKMASALDCALPSASLDIQGVTNTAIALKALLKKKSNAQQSPGKRRVQRDISTFSQALEQSLRNCLEPLQSAGKKVKLFLRDDDIDEDEETLRQLFDISMANGVPLNVEIMPEKLTAAGIKLLKQQKRLHPSLLELNQHGWSHSNHEKEGRKCEFGISRSFDQQFEDISKGKALLEKTFGDQFYPVFTPPWNRCTQETLKTLDRLGFKVFSKDKGKTRTTGFSFQEISTTLDLYRWKGNPTMKSPEEIVEALILQIETTKEEEPIGLLLHHKVMDEQAFIFLDMLLKALRQYGNIRFYTFQGLVESYGPNPF